MAEKKINERTFKVEPVLATDAMVLQARLLRLVGPAIDRLGDILQGFGEDKSEEARTRSNVAAIQAFTTIFREAEPEELAQLVKDVCEISLVRRPSGEYSRVDFDGDMSGRDQRDVIPLVMFVLKEQFSDFFAGLPGLTNLVKARRA